MTRRKSRRAELFELQRQADRLERQIRDAELAHQVEQMAVASGALDPLDLPARDLAEGPPE